MVFHGRSVTAKKNSFIAKTNARAKLKLNTEYSFNFNMRHAYFFDPETGARIN